MVCLFFACKNESGLSAQKSVRISASDSLKVSEENTFTIKKYELNGEQISFLIRNPLDTSGIVYFNMHDNENTAVASTDSCLKLFPARFIELQHKGKRHLSGIDSSGKYFYFDPNRIYSDLGIFLTLKTFNCFTPANKKAVRKFFEYISDSLLQNSKKIIAVHNSVNGFSIEKYLPDSIYAKNASAIYISPKRNPTEFFFVTEKTHFHYFKNLDYNVALQSSKAEDDGSLSIFCVKNDIFYINVEAKEGNFNEQYEMLLALQNLLKR